jgi:hypothetical protein
MLYNNTWKCGKPALVCAATYEEVAIINNTPVSKRPEYARVFMVNDEPQRLYKTWDKT